MEEAGAVVVTWNAESQVGACLDALLARGLRRLVVVDNASQDGTVAAVRQRPGVRLIANPWNRGFAAAVNQGMQALTTPCVLLINPDAELLGGIQPMIEACLQPEVAAVGGKLIGTDGRPQLGFMLRRFPTPAALAFEMLGLNRFWPGNPVNRRYRCLDIAMDEPVEAEQPAGAFLMLRREAWVALGGFDEGFYPLWFEDVDFLRRARAAGYRILYEPRAVARHIGACCVAKMRWEQRQLCWYHSLFRYASKHFGPAGCRAVLLTAIIASAMRGAGGVAQAGFHALPVYVRIMRSAASWLVRGSKKRLVQDA